MNYIGQIISTSVIQALQELWANKLRTFLSLLGITIGIFCITAVLTVLDSMKHNIQKEMSTLGSDVLYIGRWPWMDEGGEYKWWEYLKRPSMTPFEVKSIVSQVPDVAFASLCLTSGNVNVKHRDMEASSISCYAVLSDFEKIQNIEIADGRYLNASELDGGSNTVVIGDEVRKALFQTSISPLGQTISFLGKQFIIVGVLKKSGQNMAGFNFDNCVMFSYYTAASVIDVKALDNDPLLAVKGAKGRNIDEVKYEVEGVLRRIRKVKPGQGNNFAINQLSEISKTIESLFGTINVIGGGIAILSLIVGSFGIANIMFVTVKERTKIIGLKKAIGARKSSILLEFLVEAIVLCVIGGLTGIVIVLLLSVLSTYVFGFEVILSFYNFFLGIFVSIVVGILSGIIPAWSASRLDPVVAIRSN